METRLNANASTFAGTVLDSFSGPLAVLGSFPTAVYLQLPTGTVIALLTEDAVRLPIGVVLPVGSAVLQLNRFAAGGASLQDGVLRLGELSVSATERWSAQLRPVGEPGPASGLTAIAAQLAEVEIPDGDAACVVAGLLGRGPGLTPAGDDALCGLLAGAVLFDRPPAALRSAVLRALDRPGATTSLSRALLLSAVAGDGIPQLQALGAALAGSSDHAISMAWADLIAIGHSSGAALGLGVLTAAAQRAVVAA